MLFLDDIEIHGDVDDLVDYGALSAADRLQPSFS